MYDIEVFCYSYEIVTFHGVQKKKKKDWNLVFYSTPKRIHFSQPFPSLNM